MGAAAGPKRAANEMFAMCYSDQETMRLIHRAIAFAKLGTMIFMLGCVITLGVTARAQSRIQQPVGERIAVVESQTDTNKVEINALRGLVATMSDELYTMRGMGIGAVTLLGVLDTVQLVLLKRKSS